MEKQDRQPGSKKVIERKCGLLLSIRNLFPIFQKEEDLKREKKVRERDTMNFYLLLNESNKQQL